MGPSYILWVFLFLRKSGCPSSCWSSLWRGFDSLTQTCLRWIQVEYAAGISQLAYALRDIFASWLRGRNAEWCHWVGPLLESQARQRTALVCSFSLDLPKAIYCEPPACDFEKRVLCWSSPPACGMWGWWGGWKKFLWFSNNRSGYLARSTCLVSASLSPSQDSSG